MALDLRGLTQEEQFKKAAEFAGVSEKILDGIWRTESQRGNPKFMRSPAGAEGHFGIMPATRATWEQRTGRQYNPDDFGDALTLAALTMKENVGMAKGNIADALRMYNAGTDRKRWNNAETGAYVGKVLGGAEEVAFYIRNASNPAAAPLTVDEAWSMSAYDLRNKESKKTSGSTPTDKLSGLEKGVRQDVAMQAAVAALLNGTGGEEEAAEAVRELPTDALVDTFTNEAIQNRTELSYDNEAAFAADQARADAQAAEQAKVGALTFGDKFSAAFDNNTLTAALWRVMEDAESGIKIAPDPNWSVLDKANSDDILAWAQNEDEVDEQLEARSRGELNQIRSRIEQRRKNDWTIAAGSSQYGQLGYNLLAGVVDPVGWTAGLGVGKVFQLGGIGARAAFAERQIAKGFGYAAAEGVAGNVAGTAVLDALGEYQTTQDYAFAAATGGIFGTAFGTFDYMGGAAEAARREMSDLFERTRTEALEQDLTLVQEAQAKLGPNATPDDIKHMVRALELNRQQRVLRGVLGSAEDIEQIMPRTDPEALEQFRAQFGPNGTGGVPKNLPGAILTTKAAQDAIIKKYGLDLSMEDGAERLLAAEAYARAERYIAENPVDTERAKSILSQAGLESTAGRMLLSDNPLMQFAASVLLESSSGASGRRVTAAITAKTRERVYVGNTLRQYEELAKTRVGSRGGNWMSEFIQKDRLRKEFDRDVYIERDRRLNGVEGATDDPAVRAAADLLDEAYERMRKDQKFVGTLGSARLADDPVRGYSPRRWAAGVIRSMDKRAFGAFQSEVKRQFIELSGYDDKFATMFAREYTAGALRRATGNYDIPMNLHSTDAADMVRDALKAMSEKGVQMDMETILGRFSRGGASHTKRRIDLDLTRSYTDVDGQNYSLLDYIDTDNISLLRNYARRTAGETALAKFGVMGEPGLKELRVAIESRINESTMTQAQVAKARAELESFDQVAAEFLGKPFGKHNAKWADNARVLTSAIRLGGMGFTQLGEFSNAIAALGVSHAMKSVAALPKMMKEVRAKAAGKQTGGLLDSIELYTGDLGMDGYKMQGLYDVNDGFEVYGKESLDRFSKAARAANDGVRTLSLHKWVTAVQTRGVSEQIVLKALRYIKNGGEDAALRDMGITDDLARRLKGELRTIAKFDGDRVTALDLTKAEDVAAANEFAQAVARGASQIVQDTYIGETGKWAHDGFLKLLLQFRTFSLISVEKQWTRQMAVHGGAKMIGITIGAMSIAAVIHSARVAARAAGMDEKQREEFLDRNLSPLALGRASMNYVSHLGLLPDVIDAPLALAGAGSYSRAGRNDGFIGGTVAPSVGVVNDAVDVLTERNPHKAVKLLPGSSIPHFAWAINLFDNR